jgi:hypothetical protein
MANPLGLAVLAWLLLKPMKLLRTRQAALLNRIHQAEERVRAASAQDVAWIFLVEEQYGLALLRSESEFVAGLIDSLNDPDHARQWKETFGRRP